MCIYIYIHSCVTLLHLHYTEIYDLNKEKFAYKTASYMLQGHITARRVLLLPLKLVKAKER